MKDTQQQHENDPISSIIIIG